MTTLARLLLVPLACLALVGCSDDGGTGDTLPTFATLDDLVAALGDGGFDCELEYAGLEDATKTLSICTLGSSQAQLTIWKDPADVEEFAASGAATDLTVYGANWTIDLRDADTATAVATALDAATGGDTGG